jgi:hypothetical protein
MPSHAVCLSDVQKRCCWFGTDLLGLAHPWASLRAHRRKPRGAPVRALRAAPRRDRYRLGIPLPPSRPGNLALFVSQAGETADTLATLRYAHEQKQHVMSIVNGDLDQSSAKATW